MSSPAAIGAGDVWMSDLPGDERLKRGDELRGLFGSEIESKDFDRNEPIARRLVRAKDGTQRARTNLMENPEWPERFGRKVQDRIFAVQWSNGNMNSLHIPVDIRRFPWASRSSQRTTRFSSLRSRLFFPAIRLRRHRGQTAIANARNHPRPRAEIAAMLMAQLERRGAPAPARDAAARLADPQTVAIVTGQQAGLFGGPLFTLYKGLTAVKLAAQVSREHQVPAVAIFWVEAEDHDWDEVASVSVLDRRHAEAHHHDAAAAGRRTFTDRPRSRSTRGSRRSSTSSPPRCRRRNSQTSCSPICGARTSRASACPPPSRGVDGSAARRSRRHRVRMLRPRGQAAGARYLRA